jgi:outer membrane protein TolC
VSSRSRQGLALTLLLAAAGARAQQQQEPPAPPPLRPAHAQNAAPASGTDAQPLPQRVTPPAPEADTSHLRSGQLQHTAGNADQSRGATRTPDVAPVTPIAPFVDAPQPAPALADAENSKRIPSRENASGLAPRFLGFLGPYKRPHVPSLFGGDATRFESLIHDGKLYLTLDDAIALALENNLDVEAERYNLVLAGTDVVRAAGGGSLRGIDYTVQQPPNGVGGPGSPLLNANTTSTNPTTPAITDLTSLNSTNQQTQNLSQLTAGFTYAPGPAVPLFDPQLIGEAGYLRRSDTVTLTSSTGTTGTTGTGSTASGTAPPGPALQFTELNVAYLQGFSTGAQLEATVNNDSQVIYSDHSQYNPLHAPSSSVTLTQPLLRGRGRDVNLRYLRIAQLDNKVSRLLFEQQVLETVYGTSRLYFDLVSLGENVRVKQEALRAATKLRDDDRDQVSLGTLAPIELTRAEALASSSEFDLIQAQGLYRQQEVILKTQLLRTASPVFRAQFTEIVPTDRITVPEQFAPLDIPSLITEGLARRPDLAQAALQMDAGRISANASRNGALPQLNVYANVETRGATEQAYDTLGSPGTGAPVLPQNLAVGGLRTSTIYQGGIQLTLPLRNRVAAADAARDAVQLRQVQAHTERLAAQVREEIEAAAVALETAQAAFQAATRSRDYQQQLLDAERDKLSVGQSTDLLVLQNEAYVAQARSTEIAARSNWMKARIELDRALGNLLERNHIALDDAIAGKLP